MTHDTAVESPATSPPASDTERVLADARAAFDDLPPTRTGHVPGVDLYDLAGSA